MERLIEGAIVYEARKRLAKHSQTVYFALKHQKSFTKRTGQTAKTRKTGTPKSWAFDAHFDPRYCINHAKFIAKGLWNSLKEESYTPRIALRQGYPKPDGGTRYIDVFSVPDAALATIFMKTLRKRNAKIFSDSSFAYQEGKTPLDAIVRVKAMLGSEKIFISQYDFSQFFDSISHSHIENLLSKQGPFLTTKIERTFIRSVLSHKYSNAGVVTQRDRGTPQGNSISLFVSNVAAHPLDNALSRISGLFARFADDSVVVNYSYEEALKCAEAYRQFSSESGVEINPKKSSGIRLLAIEKTEMQSIDNFVFLSYKFTPDEVLVSDRSVNAIKFYCARTIYRHLLLHPRRAKKVSLRRIRGLQYDWDLVTCLNELRRYVYGGIEQSKINDYLSDKINLANVQGAVSYFSLVERGDQFRMLDGWLVNCLHRALAERVRFIRTHTSRKGHRLLSVDELVNASWYKFKKLPMETTVPSFFSAWRASRKSLARHGLGGVDAIGTGYSYS